MERPTLDVRVASQHFPQLSCVRGVAVGKESMRFVCTGSAVFIVSADGTLESCNLNTQEEVTFVQILIWVCVYR